MTDLSNVMVVGIGLGTVFVGLICLIVLCYIMSAVCRMFAKEKQAPSENTQVVSTPTANTASQPIANKQEILAACCAVIAEELGTEANNIKVLSFKRV
ncbi:MAG: OadG family protein [Clostridia bacterium]|nr:OadG family protein [Clostridia bacterium]